MQVRLVGDSGEIHGATDTLVAHEPQSLKHSPPAIPNFRKIYSPALLLFLAQEIPRAFRWTWVLKEAGITVMGILES